MMAKIATFQVKNATFLTSLRYDPISTLFQPRSLPALLAISFVLGAGLTLTMLPLPVIFGTASFWDFPHGTVPGGTVDMAQTLIGYRYFAAAPWTVPILNIPSLVPPAGTNLLWLDAVPLLCILGKLIFTISGTEVNLIGVFLFFCFALPGVAMTSVLWVAGQRGLLCALAAATIVDSMPFFLFEWGHVALCAQFLIILALLLYLLSQQRPNDTSVSIAWIGLLVTTLLVSNYLFVMVGGVWFAALVQLGLSRRLTPLRFVIETVAAIGIVLGFAAISGILTSDLRFGGSHDFGVFSMNLGSPFVPQLSGALPPFAAYWIGMRSQVFAYVGLGVLLVLAVALPALVRLSGRRARSHIVLICVFSGFFLFALSNKITLGSHTLLHIPLSDRIAFALGAFRASGRFFWPIGYAVTAASILAILRSFHHRSAFVILAVASFLQFIDASPQRRAIAASIRGAAPAVVDRTQLANAMASSRSVMIFPTSRCVATATDSSGATDGGAAQASQDQLLGQAAVEIQVLAARRNLPINSAITDRLSTDCAAEAATRLQPLDPDTAYFYLTGVAPGINQLGGHDPAQVCRLLTWVHFCLIPSTPGRPLQ